MAEAEGIPPTASVASVGPSIRYIGAHCYVMNIVASTTTAQTVWDFNSGNGYIVGRIYVNGGAKLAVQGVGAYTVWQLSFNDIIIANLKTETATEDSPPTVYNDILIPPLTKVKLICDSDTTEANTLMSGIFTGRVYGAF